MGTYCAPLLADLFLVCYERDFMMSLLRIRTLKLLKLSMQRLDDLLNIDNTYFDGMVNKFTHQTSIK